MWWFRSLFDFHPEKIAEDFNWVAEPVSSPSSVVSDCWYLEAASRKMPRWDLSPMGFWELQAPWTLKTGCLCRSHPPKFNSSPHKSYRDPKGSRIIFQPSIFRVNSLLNLGAHVAAMLQPKSWKTRFSVDKLCPNTDATKIFHWAANQVPVAVPQILVYKYLFPFRIKSNISFYFLPLRSSDATEDENHHFRWSAGRPGHSVWASKIRIPCRALCRLRTWNSLRLRTCDIW